MSKVYNNGESTTILTLQLRPGGLYTPSKPKGSEDDFDAYFEALLSGRDTREEVKRLRSLGYTTNNIMTALNNAFGVVGALILGEFAVSAGLFVAEVLLYMAAVAVATFTQPSFELGYAFKLSRMLFLVLTALFGVWGFVGGIVLVTVVLATTQTALGTGYLYPVVPFDKVALRRLLVRRILHRNNALKK